MTFRVLGVDYMALLRMLPFLKRLRVMLTGIRSVSFFLVWGLTFTRMRGIVRYILSETGVGPVPILPVVSHMFPPAFLSSQAHWESLGL